MNVKHRVLAALGRLDDDATHDQVARALSDVGSRSGIREEIVTTGRISFGPREAYALIAGGPSPVNVNQLIEELLRPVTATS